MISEELISVSLDDLKIIVYKHQTALKKTKTEMLYEIVVSAQRLSFLIQYLLRRTEWLTF